MLDVIDVTAVYTQMFNAKVNVLLSKLGACADVQQIRNEAFTTRVKHLANVTRNLFAAQQGDLAPLWMSLPPFNEAWSIPPSFCPAQQIQYKHNLDERLVHLFICILGWKKLYQVVILLLC